MSQVESRGGWVLTYSARLRATCSGFGCATREKESNSKKDSFTSAWSHGLACLSSPSVRKCEKLHPWKAADDADRGAAFRGGHAGIRAGIPTQPKRQRGASGSITLNRDHGLPVGLSH